MLKSWNKQYFQLHWKDALLQSTRQSPAISTQQDTCPPSNKGLTLVMLLTLESIPKPQSVIIIYRFWVLVAHPHFCQHPTGSETPCGRFPGASQWALARTSARARPGCSREGRPALFAAPPAGGPLPGERNSREWFAYTFKELSREKWKLNSQTCSYKIWFKKEEEGLLWAFGVDADHI